MKHASAAAKAANKAALAALKTATEAKDIPAMEAAISTMTPALQERLATDLDKLTVHVPFAPAFEADGETLKPLADGVLPQQVGEAIIDRLRASDKAGNQAAWLYYRASQKGEVFASNVLISINTGALSRSALANMKSVAERVIPFKLATGIAAPLSTLKDAIAAMAEKNGAPKRTPEAIALIEAFKAPGATQAAIRDLRAKYDKETGLPKAPALPAPKASEAPAAPAAPAPTGITAEVRAEREATEAAAAAATVTQAPKLAPPTEHEKAVLAGITLPLRTVLKYVTANSVTGADREALVDRLREIAKLLNLTLA